MQGARCDESARSGFGLHHGHDYARAAIRQEACFQAEACSRLFLFAVRHLSGMDRRGSPRVDRQTDGRTENLTRTADRMPDESRRPPGRKPRRRDCENSPREVWAISEVAAQEKQTQFYLTLRRTSNSQELAKIDPDCASPQSKTHQEQCMLKSSLTSGSISVALNGQTRGTSS